jgi:hypothetical protein
MNKNEGKNLAEYVAGILSGEVKVRHSQYLAHATGINRDKELADAAREVGENVYRIAHLINPANAHEISDSIITKGWEQ